jgi:nicotinate-nucleotide pyrophosphorylase (carboxylating)
MSYSFHPLDHSIIDLALNEDLGANRCDVTTDTLFATQNSIQKAHIVSKHPEKITICGIELIQKLFLKINSNCRIFSDYQDGHELQPGAVLLTIETDAATLLKGERVALNFLRHLSAIASLTTRYVDTVKLTSLKILDTRKTTPGLRGLEKYAVHCGGGVNHRMGLYDAFMIKDTHVDLLGGMEYALQNLPQLNSHGLPVIVEVRSPKELDIVLQLGQGKVNRVLFDNMQTQELRSGVLACCNTFETEASGNINLNTISEVAATGVEFASIGRLTYDAGHVDLSMQISV